MTQREFNNTILSIVEDLENGKIPTTGTLNTIKETASQNIFKLDTRNATRQNKPSKKQIENEEIKTNIITLLSSQTEPLSSAEIATSYNETYNTEYTASKMSALCTQLVKENRLTVEKIKSSSKSGGKINGYMIPTE